MKREKFIIGTRGSELSLIQTQIIKDLLQDLVPHTPIEIVTIKTSGDKNMNPIPLDSIGKGWFTKEIDKQLLEGKIDIAVHSLKDLMDTLTPGLIITAIPKREDASEALVSRNDLPLDKLKKGAVIGTDSMRRKMQILSKRPDLIVKSVRGNVNKRLEKLYAGEYDGLILAVAGLNRLGFKNKIAQYFDVKDFIPSPGQGALAVVSRENDEELNNFLIKLNHNPCVIAVTAERAFSRAIGGGCSMPVGAYAQIKGRTLTLYGMLGSHDEKHMIKDIIRGRIDDPNGLGQRLADRFLKYATIWQNEGKARYVVLTREEKKNNEFANQLNINGLHTLMCPSIFFSKNLSSLSFKKYLNDITSYNWILFTSSNGIRFFIEGLKEAGQDVSVLKHISLGVVGEKTAQTAKECGLSVTFSPHIFTAKNLVKTLPAIKGKKVLFPRSIKADSKIKSQLEEKGAIVTDMPVYKTGYKRWDKSKWEKLLLAHEILCLTFTSPSTIEGFFKNIDNTLHKEILSLPVISIGPVTTRAAKKYGFTRVFTSDIHTIEGMLTKLNESIL